MVVPLLFLLANIFQCSVGSVLRRSSKEPLNVQNAVDLDEMDVDIDSSTSSPSISSSTNMNMVGGAKSDGIAMAASASIQGDVTIMPLSNTPIDMSVIPEPVPKVDLVEPSSLPSYGGIGSLRIIGQHFGTEMDLDQVVSINGRACKETKWISVTELECIGPASFTVGTNALVQVSVARSTSDPEIDGVTLEYEPPIVSRIIPAVGPTHGHTLIRVLGRNLGDLHVAGAERPTVMIGTLPCAQVVLINSTEIHCVTGRLDGEPGNYIVSVSVDGVTSNTTAGPRVGNNEYTYELPTVQRIEPAVGPTFGVTRITLHGSGYGKSSDKKIRRSVIIGSKECKNIQVVSDVELSCELPPSQLGQATPDGVAVDLLIDSQKAINNPGHPTDPLLFHYVKMIIDTVGVEQVLDENDPVYESAIVMKEIVYNIIGDQLAPWNVRPENCDDKNDLEQCSTNCLLSEHLDSDSKLKCDKNDVNTVEHCNGGGRFTCLCQRKGHKNGRDTSEMVAVRPKCKVNAELVPAISFDDREDERAKYTCPRVEVVETNHLRCHLPKDNGLGGSMNVTVVRNQGLGKATISAQFLQRPVITGVKASEDFQSGPLTLVGYWLGNNKNNNLFTVMIGDKKCMNVQRKLLTEGNEHPEEGTLTCVLEKGSLSGPGGLDVRIYAKDISTADMNKGVNAELRINVEIPNPIILSVTPSVIGTYGRSTLTISGESVASMLFESTVAVGNKPCLNVVKVNPDTLTCTAPSGPSEDYFGPIPVTVNILTHNGTNNNVLKYGRSEITQIIPPRVESVGGQIVTVRGLLLGDDGKGPGFPQDPLLTLGGASCTKVKRSPKKKNEFTCLTGPSKPGFNLMASLSLDEHDPKIENPVVEIIPPQIVSLNPTEGPTYGENVIVITGTGFGKKENLVAAFVGDEPCIKTTLVSEKKVLCVAPKTTSEKVELVRVEVSSVPSIAWSSNSTDSIAYKYINYGLLRIDPSFGPAYGNTTFKLFGRFLGRLMMDKNGKKNEYFSLPDVSVGGVPCVSSTLIEEEGSGASSGHYVTCVTPPSVPGEKTIDITVNEVKSTENVIQYDYRVPEIKSISPNDGPTYGGVVVDILGEGLGTEYSQPLVKFGAGVVCENPKIIEPHTHLQCLLPSTVNPGATTVTVSVNGVVSKLPTKREDHPATFNYQPPIISSLTPDTGATYGDWLITITGEHFGRGGKTSEELSTTVSVGGTPCRDIKVFPDERKITCTTPNTVPGKTKVVVEVGGVPSEAAILHSKGPAVDLVSPSFGPSYGGNTLIVSGTHLADLNNPNVEVEVFIGDQACTDVVTKSETHVECSAPSAHNEKSLNKDLDVSVKILGVSTKVGVYQYQPPQVDNVLPRKGPVRGGTQLTIVGNHLAGRGEQFPPTVRLGKGESSTTCEVIASKEKSLHCITNDRIISGKVPVVVSVDGISSKKRPNTNASFTFVPPIVEDVTPNVIPTYGNTVIDVQGNYFGNDTNKLFVVVGGIPCTDLELIDDTHLRCIAPPNRAPTIANPDESHEVVVTYNKASSTKDGVNVTTSARRVRYKAPELRRVVPDHSYRDENRLITLEGRFLGKTDNVETSILLGNNEVCEKVRRITEHMVTCIVPPGFSGTYDVSVRVGEDTSTLVQAFRRNYGEIILDRLSSTYLPFWTDTKLSIVLHTYGLSSANNLKIKIGGADCTNIKSTVLSSEVLANHTLRQLECVLLANKQGPPGEVSLVVALRDGLGEDVEMNATTMTVGHPRFSIEPNVIPSYGRAVGTFKYQEMSDVVGEEQLITKHIGSITVGGLPCVGVKVDSATKTIQCSFPRGPAGDTVVKMELLWNGKKTLIGEIPITYAAPIVTQSIPSSGTTLGGDLLKLVGKYFGQDQDHVRVKIGGQTCNHIQRYNETLLHCVTGTHLSAEGNYPIEVTVTAADEVDSSKMTDNVVTSDTGAGATEFRYRGPTASGIQPPFGTPFGGDIINISGTGFGSASDNHDSILAFVGGKPCKLTTWLSESTVECVTPAGFGEMVDVTVSVAGKTFDVPDKFKYLKPRVISSIPNRGPAWRPTRITLRGPSVIPSDLEGESAKTLTVRIGPSQCTDVEIVRDYKDSSKNILKCTTTPVRVGSMTYPIIVSDGTKFSDPKGAANFTFEDPIITERPLQQPFYGEIEQAFFGRNFGNEFGLKPENFTILIGDNECPNIKWVSDNEIKCTPNENTGAAVPITVVVNDWDSEPTDLSTLAFNEPLIRFITPGGIPTYGTDKITITGANLGTPAMYKENRVVIDVDGQKCENLKLIASPRLTGSSIINMAVECDAPPAQGAVIPHFSAVSILIDDVHGNTNQHSLRYLSPVVHAIHPASVPATGYEDILIRGDHFGDGSQVLLASVNGTLCEETTWISESSIKCKVPPGHTEAKASIIVSVNGQTNPYNLYNQLLRYTGPKVLAVMPVKGPAYGGTRITLTGRGLASTTTPVVGVPFIKIANSSCVDVEVISDEKVTCTTTDSFDVGFQPIRLKLWTGTGYSSTDEEEAYDLTNDKNQSNTVRRFFYDGPVIRHISPSDGAAYGGDLLHLWGTNFGNGSIFTEVHVGKHGVCNNLTVLSDEHITCNTPAGATRNNPIALQVGLNVARQVKNFTFHYRLPYVQCVDPAFTTTGGGERITLLGRDFGTPELKPMAFINGTECTNLKYVSEHVLTCIAPPMKAGTGYDVIVTVLDGETGTYHEPHFIFSGIDNRLMSYNRPIVDGVGRNSVTSGPAYGHQEFEVLGEHVGHGWDLEPPTVYIGSMPCLETLILTNFSLLCMTPMYNNSVNGGFKELPVTVRLGPTDSITVPSLNYTFLRPIVTNVEGSSFGPEYGGTKLTLVGVGLGVPIVARPKIFVGNSPCEEVKVIDDTRVTCVTTEGAGSHLNVTLFNGMDAAVKTEFKFTYQQSVVTEITPTKVRWFGNEWIIVDGIHLGSMRYPPVVTIDGALCLKTRYMGGSLQCLAPPGSKSEAVVVVRVGNTTSRRNNNENMTDYVEFTPPVIRSITAGISIPNGKEGSNKTEGIAAVPQYGGGWVSIRGDNLAVTLEDCYDKAGCASLNTSIVIGTSVCNRSMIERDGITGQPTLLCQTTAKARAGNKAVKIIANGMESKSMNLLFSAPVVESVSPPEGAFNEKHRLTIRGNFFGDKSGNMSTEVTVGGQPCDHVVRRSPELLSCLSPIGVEFMTGNSNDTTLHDAPIRVSVDGISSTGRVVFTRTLKEDANKTNFEYLPPVISSLADEKKGPAFGYRNITLYGDNFGLVDSGNVVAMIHGHPCVSTQWVSKTKLTCVTPTLTMDDRIQHDIVQEEHSTEVPAAVAVVIDGVHNDDTVPTVYYNYLLPRIFKVSPSMGPAYGGTKITILGKRLGDQTLPGQVLTNVQLGPFMCENITVVDQFEVKCITAPGRNTFPVNLNVNGVPSIYNTSDDNDPNSTTTSFTYLPMEVHTLSRKEVPSYGGDRVVIQGKYLGDRADQHPIAFIGGRPCRETIWINPEKIVCITPHSPAGNHHVSVSIGATTSLITRDTPSIKVIDPTVRSIDVNKGGAAGGENITIQGEYFGSTGGANDIIALVGGVPCSRTYSLSERSVICTTPARFIGDSKALISVSVDGHMENSTKIGSKRLSRIVYNYRILRVTSIDIDSGPTEGGYEITIYGESFGKTSVAYIGERRCQKTIPNMDHHSLVCVVPEGVGAGHIVEVRVRKTISSLTASDEKVRFNYDLPTVTELKPARFDKHGGEIINITGSNFGPAEHPLIVHIGDMMALDVMHHSHTSFSCVTPPGKGQGKIIVTVANQTSASNDATISTGGNYLYIPAEITSFEPKFGPTSGGWLLTIYGRGFGPNAEELAAANKTAKKEMEEDLKIEDELDMDEIKKENNAISAANKTLTEEELEEEASKKAFLNAEKAMEKAELDGDKNATSNAAKEEQLEEADEERRMAEAKSLENAAVEERKKRAAKAEAIEKIALARSEARLDEEKKASEDAEKEEDEKESSLESKADAADGVETKESDETIKAAKIPTVGDHQSTEELDFAAANAAAAPTDESEMDKLDHLAEESAKRFRDTELNTNDQASPSMRFRQSSDGASNVVPSMMKALPTGYVSPQVVVSRNSDLSQFIFEDNLLEVDQKTNDEKRRLKRAQAAYRLSEWAQKSRNADPYEPFVAAPRFREERHTKTITGSKTFSRGVWINGVPCSNVTWVSDSKITCIVPEGVGGHLNVKLVTPMDGGVAAEILNNETTYLSYTPALVESVDIDIGYYGTIIVAKGSNFGNFSIPTAYIGNRPCTETTRLSYNTVRCVVPKGAGKDLPVTVAVGGQRGLIDGAATYSYPPPQVLRTFPDGGSGKGGNIVTIMGRNYGDAESLGNVTVGMIGERKCIKTTIVSDTLIECVAPSGVGRNLHISIWANGQESVTPVRYVHSNGTSMMKLVDTTTRNVTDVEGTKNSTTIVLVGGNNGTVAGNKSSNGTSARLTAAFMASGAEVSDEALYSYPTPEISLIVPDSVSGKGGDVIEIHGNSFGESGASIKVSIDKKPCVDIEIISSKLIKCKTPPGKGDAKPVIVITGGQPSKLYDWFEYDGPRIWFSSPNRVIKEQDEKTKITFTGVHLGLNEDDANVQALTVGGYPCSEPKRVSSKEWSCTIREMGRMGKNAPVQIHLPNRKRPSPPNVSVATFNFKAEPEVMINIPSFGSKDGGEEMSIEGIFGPSKPLSVNVQIGGESCDNSEWISPRQIKCLYVIPGKGHKTVSVQVNGAIALLSKKNTIKTEGSLTYDYDPPIVVSISPKRGPTAGGVPITIKGKFDGVASVTVRGAECPIKSFDATYITCTLPEGVGAQAPLRVVSLEGSQSPAIPFAYDGPVVVETGPKDLSPKVDDGRRLWVRVNNLGPQGKENEIAEHIAVVLEDSPLMEEKEKERKAVDSNNTNSTPNGSAPVIDAVTSDSASGGELCSDVRWGKEPNTITCVPSPGFGYRSLIVVVSGQKSPVSNMSYAPAVVAGIHPISEDPGKEIKMTIVGSRFTSAPIEVMSVYIGKQECRNLNIESDSQLTCNITVRPGGNKFVNVQIADLKSSKPGLTFTATPPTVDKVEPNSCKLSGGCLLKITGANYFMNIPTAVSLGKLACENVQVLSMNTITCVAPRGTSGSQMVVVDIGGARNDDEESIAAQKTSGLFSYPAATVNKVRPTHGAKT
jgi:hypothetical protein